MAERQFGPYRLVRQIAVGGMAEIHLAKTKGIADFEKYVALKMIHPNFAEDEQFIQMLVDEAKIAVQLTHGNIAQTFDLGRVGDTYYITMEYVDGADLYKILRRGSEQDLEMPLDVCAFIGKEIASALDHAHRKRDNFGKPLGIVHRDVSPQNVLISYAGEIKLVDFGIAKATMKARQTAVGVIKGKYYYMSPEQAWGDNIDYRSDIFSAGIVLYEMITGQMLYLEEDLHKLLDMARKADIAPPSRLRKGVPPQLEKIVMHALQRLPGERYQSAGDFATDLERFLHTYSPVFTAGKVSQLIRKIVGDPIQVPTVHDVPSIEMRDGAMSTHPLHDSEVLKTRDELRDENSVIFRVDELAPGARPGQPAVKQSAPRMTRPADQLPGAEPELAPTATAKPLNVKAPRPRMQAHEETRQIAPAPSGPPGSPGSAGSDDDTSGLLSPGGQRVGAAGSTWESDTHDESLENIGERTLISGPSGGSFMMDVAGEEGVDATLVTHAPQPDTDTHATLAAHDSHDSIDDDDHDDEEGPTLAREFGPNERPAVRVARPKMPAPPALAANIQSPAVSALHKPKASRRTPPGGVPAQGNVLQQIVARQGAAPMPVPVTRPAEPTTHSIPPSSTPPPLPLAHTHPPPGLAHAHPPSQFPNATPGAQQAAPAYANDASGLPLALQTPPSGVPVQPVPGVPPHLQPYLHVQGYPAPQQITPGALYQLSPYGAPPPQPMTLTGQLRLFEADEMPSHYKLGAARRRWFMYIVAGIVAISVAAGTTFLIIRTTRDTSPMTGSIHIESTPPGAEVVYDGNRLVDRTPLTITDVPLGTRHDLRVELARHTTYVDSIDIPKSGGEVPVMAILKPITGKIVVNSVPGGAEVWINGVMRGRTPGTINDVDMDTAKTLELRLQGHQPKIVNLEWPANGQVALDLKLER